LFAVVDSRRDYMATFSTITVATNRAEAMASSHESPVDRPILSRRKRKSSEEESALIERLKAGDQEALEAIFDLYSPKLYNIAHRMLGDVADTEEVIQDVFWTAYRKAKTFRGNSQFSTWLYRLTINAALGRIRRRETKKSNTKNFCPSFSKTGITWSGP
jgi:hypothetical protein